MTHDDVGHHESSPIAADLFCWTFSGRSSTGLLISGLYVKRGPFFFSSLYPSGVGAGAPYCARRSSILNRMLKMASQQGRRELGDRSVPLGYVAGRRASDNDAGGRFQRPARSPFPRMPDTSPAPSSAYRSSSPCRRV